MNNSRQFGKNVFIFIRGMEKLRAVIVLICLILLFLTAIPIKIALLICLRQGVHFSAGIAPFSGRLALHRAKKHVLRKKKSPNPNRNTAAVWKMLRRLAGKLHMEQLRMEGSICASDAAATALFCGALQAMAGSIAPLLPPGRVHFSLRPDYSGNGPNAAFYGMLSIRAGHIIPAALQGAWHYFSLMRRQKHGKASD